VTRRLPRPVRIGLQVAVSAAVIAYLLWQIDVGETIHLIGDANGLYLLAALAIFMATTWGMAWRWQILLASKGIREPLGWLTSLYFIGYAAGQVLPTGVGGDAVRIVEHSRRRPDAKGEAAAAVLIERMLGAAGTLVMVAIGLVAAIGRYDDITYLVWIELAFVAAVAACFVLLFSKRARNRLGWLAPLADRVRLERAGRSLYDALHGYRERPGVLFVVLSLTIVIQFVRVISIWLCGLAVGVHESPLVYVILGPLLFLVMMVPFTINGLGVREAFFVAFLGRFGVDADAAFATGFLFYAVTIATSVPGGLIMLWRSVRPSLAGVRRA
jgi:glycosyltransferase 2 family protein